jgi:hypothetical protein
MNVLLFYIINIILIVHDFAVFILFLFHDKLEETWIGFFFSILVILVDICIIVKKFTSEILIPIHYILFMFASIFITKVYYSKNNFMFIILYFFMLTICYAYIMIYHNNLHNSISQPENINNYISISEEINIVTNRYEQTECAICCDVLNFSEPRTIVELKCLHIFHLECYNKQLENKYFECSICRV